MIYYKKTKLNEIRHLFQSIIKRKINLSLIVNYKEF